ncbi:DegV family protein with EDD domain [Actinomadura hallensis]|uniref:DegV family protein with EDD domain n=1 Tax=Actinomadura hallensis TaxID=337895 RepID=A0A543IIC7_9ACTN|nr:DegV family protein [Actinomadura hallensis]TQM70324.1 DegV family protein with EDD domain [Actinomadura hallensis]HLV73260.1 DegV family protein [Vulgatibacteraceae bacterium]
MGSAVAVVTDSTAYLAPGLAERHGLIIVPLQIAVGGATRDENDITTAEAARALKEWQPVTTSRPAPERFAEAYRAAAGSGAREVVSVHLSAAMSGTVEAARLAAGAAPIPVRVVDSGTVGMGLGFAALTAAAAARSGGTAEQVADAAARRAALTRSLIYVDTLEHLRRGGRIGAAATLLGSALMVKPLLELREGRLAPLEKVRTSSRALARLEELAVTEAGERRVDLGVQHLAAAGRAESLAARLRDRIPNVQDTYVGEVGPVIGAHVGPGMLGVVVAPLS